MDSGGVVIPAPETSERPQKNNRALIGVLIAAGVVILGLVVAIIVVNVVNSKPNMTPITLNGNDAAVTDARIRGKILEDENYTVSDAAEEYESSIEQGDIYYKVYLGLRYGDFMYMYSKDIAQPLSILTNLEEEVLATEDNILAVDYYAGIRGLYKKINDEDNASYYNCRVVTILEENEAEEEESAEAEVSEGSGEAENGTTEESENSEEVTE